MGLDCVPVGLPKPGFEKAWAKIVGMVEAGEDIGENEAEEFSENTFMACEMLDAPIVGKDDSANKWAIENLGRAPGETDAELIARVSGYRALDLIAEHCDGISKYSAAGLGWVDETSLRGEFFRDCEDVLPVNVAERPWTSMTSDEAVAFGRTLQNIVVDLRAEHGDIAPDPDTDEFEIADKIDFLDSAARWYTFWGSRGHPIEADF
ncbi:MAG: hypothetical protein AAGF29_00510 [Pseudomonadota bacterium]